MWPGATARFSFFCSEHVTQIVVPRRTSDAEHADPHRALVCSVCNGSTGAIVPLPAYTILVTPYSRVDARAGRGLQPYLRGLFLSLHIALLWNRLLSFFLREQRENPLALIFVSGRCRQLSETLHVLLVDELEDLIVFGRFHQWSPEGWRTRCD